MSVNMNDDPTFEVWAIIELDENKINKIYMPGSMKNVLI